MNVLLTKLLVGFLAIIFVACTCVLLYKSILVFVRILVKRKISFDNFLFLAYMLIIAVSSFYIGDLIQSL